MKEALLKGTLLFGIPRALNVFYALAKVLPDAESIDREVVRKELGNPLSEETVQRGLDYFENIYRKDMPAILEPMDRLFPDLRGFCPSRSFFLFKILIYFRYSRRLDCPFRIWHLHVRNKGPHTNRDEYDDDCFPAANGCANAGEVAHERAVEE